MVEKTKVTVQLALVEPRKPVESSFSHRKLKNFALIIVRNEKRIGNAKSGRGQSKTLTAVARLRS
jgi:hypothetical protein